jgi:hypothetical protein
MTDPLKSLLVRADLINEGIKEVTSSFRGVSKYLDFKFEILTIPTTLAIQSFKQFISGLN